MNEFIVWDEDNEEFIDETKCIFKNGILYRNDKYYITQVSEDFTMFDYIRKNDVDGKKIYADSSIVEFDFIQIETIGKQSDKVKVRGYFTFNSETSAYDLSFFHNWVSFMANDHINVHMKKEDIKRASNFKIIDTIQKNKLGLIK